MLEWIGILICLLHAGFFSGLNLGFFGVSRLRLEIQADVGNKDAIRILSLRKDAHFLLATILWANVSANVLLALISDSILSGVWAFVFSTFVITMLGEIFPQAYLAKHALRFSFLLVPIVRFYQSLLYPLAKPTGMLLDSWLGKEEIIYFQEEEIIHMLKRHVHSGHTDIEQMESQGAVNFFELDDIKLRDEGEIVDKLSIIALEANEKGLPIFPDFQHNSSDPFLQKLHASGKKWVIITDLKDKPLVVVNADGFLRDVIYSKEGKSILSYCHRPILVTEPGITLGEVVFNFKVRAEHSEDDVIDDDLILYWKKEKRIITGADILGRLLRGIVKRIERETK
ncbi:MAG: DUF21 domain-containing protein [Candidatus Omnitrophica bacterium]|nr:DUF21 domain-containing protein [Candidatus Omnitrophota bacterium]